MKISTIEGQVMAHALASLTPDQFHVVFGWLLGATEAELAEDLGYTRDRIHQIKRTAISVMRRAVARDLGLRVAA